MYTCIYIFIKKNRLNAFQKAIFKAKNSGSSLKISLPFDNILDIEYTDNTEFQQFLKIRVVGIEDSFVMDEVCRHNRKNMHYIYLKSAYLYHYFY